MILNCKIKDFFVNTLKEGTELQIDTDSNTIKILNCEKLQECYTAMWRKSNLKKERYLNCDPYDSIYIDGYNEAGKALIVGLVRAELISDNFQELNSWWENLVSNPKLESNLNIEKNIIITLEKSFKCEKCNNELKKAEEISVIWSRTSDFLLYTCRCGLKHYIPEEISYFN